MTTVWEKNVSKDLMVVGLLFLLLFGFVKPGWTQEKVSGGKSVLPTPEMLQYAVTDLREIMKQALERNGQIEEKNKALRAKIVSFEDQSRLQEEKKKELLAEQENLQTIIKLKVQELETFKERLKDVEETKKNSGNQQEQIRKSLSDYKAKQEMLQTEAAQLNEEVRYFQKRQNLKVTKKGSKDLTSRKKEIKEQTAEKQREIERLGKDMPQVLRALEVTRQEKELLSKEQESLNNECDQLRRQQRQLAARAALSTQDENIGGVETDMVKKTKQSIKDLTEYKAALEEAVDVLETVRKKVALGWQTHQKQIGVWQNSLAQESEILKKRISLLNEYLLDSKRPPVAVIKKSLPAVPVQNTQGDLKNELALARSAIKDYRLQEKNLFGEIKRLRQNVKNAKLVPQPKDTSTAERKRLMKMLSRYENKVSPRVKEEVVEQREETTNADSDPGIAQQIEDLKARESVLSGSLSIIESRYQQEKVVADAFLEEESQLTEYLAVLQKENQGLQEKILTLLMAVDKTKKAEEIPAEK